MIEVRKLDGSEMFLNEDLIERVEHAVSGQSALYMIDGGHIIVANEVATVVTRIRNEKVALLHRALEGSLYEPESPEGMSPVTSVTRLSQVRGQ